MLSNVVWGQISLQGEANYKLIIKGYQGEDPKACGDIYGLRELNIIYDNGSKENLWDGRIWNQHFNHEKLYSKSKKIRGVEIYSINRWETWIGCNGGPNHDRTTININGVCTSQFFSNPLHVTRDVTIQSFPTYKINFNPSRQYILGSEQNLKISLPSNLENSDYIWKYSIAGQTPKSFSPRYNNNPILDVPASEFISENDYGKIISVWVESQCQNNGVVQKSNIFHFISYKEAPHISSSQVFPTKCFDSEDGSVLINFDRKLLPNESLEYVLTNKDTGTTFRNGNISTDLQNSTSITLNDIPAGSFELKFLGNYLGNATYTDGAAHSFNFEVTKPTAVTFDATHKNVYCHAGSDGEISITASGGQGSFQYFITKNGQHFADWTNFNNGNSATIKNLDAGTYAVKVRDTNFCIAKNPTNSSLEKEVTLNITQPENPIALSEIETFTPTGYGLSNGYISVRVTGGTPNSDGSYFYEWRKNAPDGEIITSNIITDNTNQPFTIKLGNIPAGTYYLTVKDKNYSVATSNLNHCGIISKVFNVSQPEPLIVNIKVQEVISCNINNNYRSKNDHNQNNIPDEAEDGVLFADVKGGVKNYFYQWQISNGGVFQNIPNATENKLANLSEGTYKVIIKDKNNNTTEAVYTLSYPEELKLNITANTISCYNGNSGIISALVTGGTGNYSYQWSNGETTPTIKNLPADKYTLLITDGKGCNVYGKTEIKQSSEIIITDISVKNPTCYGANNGEIKVSISGGKLPYSIKWSNNATTEHLSNIGAGTYTLIITDANGCSISKKYTLSQPDALTIDLGQDITLCSGDSQSYDVTIDDPLATYQWLDQNGNTISTSAKINISNAGTYTVIITNVNGCQATDSVVIKNSLDVLNPHFLVSTHSYTDSSVILVNTSEPKPQSVEWIVPNDNTIQVVNKNNDYLELQFSTPGSFTIGLKGNQGECSKIFYKNIIVENNNSGIDTKPNKASNIQDFNILPNPNKGIFEVLVNLYQEKSIKIRILDMLSRPISVEIAKSANKKFVIPYNISIPAGNYIVILEAGDEVLVKRMIVHQ